jgi:hypothetical protein
MLDIHIHTIPHGSQRYNTVGDWVFSDEEKTLTIFVSALSDQKYEFLVALHELVEAYLCQCSGIPGEKVDQFDLGFIDGDEPGDKSDCPYRDQHSIASGIERTISGVLGIGWLDYERELIDVEVEQGRKE